MAMGPEVAEGRGRVREIVADPTIRRILANTGWLVGARGLVVPLALLESILVARLLGPDLYGVLGIVITVVVALTRLLSFRMNEFVVKYLAEALQRRRRAEAAATLKAALLAEAATSTLAFLVALLVAGIAARYFVGDPAAVGAIRLYALVLLAQATVESSGGALQVFDRFRQQAGVNVFRKLVLLAGITAVFAAGAELTGVLLAYLAAQGAASVYQTALAVREARGRLGADWWRTPLGTLAPRWREMRRFAITTNLGATLGLIVKESDLLWIAWFRSPVEAGFFRLATALLKVPFAAGSPLTRALYPELARSIADRSFAAARRLLGRCTLLASAWVLPVCAVIALFAPWLVRTFYGAGFLPAVPAIRILLIGIGLAQLFFWTRPALLALGRPDVALRITALHTVLKVALALALVPIWGYLALAGILSGLYAIGVALALLFLQAELKRRGAASRQATGSEQA